MTSLLKFNERAGARAFSGRWQRDAGADRAAGTRLQGNEGAAFTSNERDRAGQPETHVGRPRARDDGRASAACGRHQSGSGMAGKPRKARRAALPCLNRNNSTTAPARVQYPEPNRLNCWGVRGSESQIKQAKKTAFALVFNLALMVGRHGMNRIVFGTLGFANPKPGDSRPDPNFNRREAERRFNSLNSHVLKPLFLEMIVVPERGEKAGRIHYHVLAAVAEDVRTGVDFKAFGSRNYRTAPRALREIWKLFRSGKGGTGKAASYGFGRTEWMPIKSNAEGISKYVGKYIAKQFDGRRPEDKGMRLVRYTRGTNYCRATFSWFTPGGRLWRWQVGRFAQKHGCPDLDALADKFGSRWAYKLSEEIMGQPDEPKNPALLKVWRETRETKARVEAALSDSSLSAAHAQLFVKSILVREPLAGQRLKNEVETTFIARDGSSERVSELAGSIRAQRSTPIVGESTPLHISSCAART